MQTQTSTATAPTKCGIPLDKKLFTKAIAKAQDVRPRVVHIGAHYAVLQSDHKSWAHVVFRVQEGRLFASCTCYAHTRGDQGKPVPCYHIPAAALSRRAADQIVIDAPEEDPEMIECENAPMCAPGLCGSHCETASAMAEEAYRHFNHADALLRKPEGSNAVIYQGWEV